MDLEKANEYAALIIEKSKVIENLKEKRKFAENLAGVEFSGEVPSNYYRDGIERKSFRVSGESSLIKLARTILIQEIEEQIQKAEKELERFIKNGFEEEK